MDTQIIVRGPGLRYVIDQDGRLGNKGKGISNIIPLSDDDGVTWHADGLACFRRSKSLNGDLVLHFRVGAGGDQIRWISADGSTGYWDLLKRFYRSRDNATKVAA